MALHPAVAERLARLAPDQRAAATAPPGPVLCIAPAGSGKTTTLVARVAWLIASGADPARICAVTFNRRAAEELSSRLADALAPLGFAAGGAVPGDTGASNTGARGTRAGGPGVGGVRVRTFHALGREILTSAGQAVEPLVNRMTVLRRIAPAAGPAGWRLLDDAFSRLKLDQGVCAADVARDPAPGPLGTTFLAYEAALGELGGLDFDDLVARALRTLEGDEGLLHRWREACAHLLVDETQDVDRSQLRLALLLAAPANRIFLVGDDDQTIYGWRLADVRRVIGLAAELPGLHRVDLTVNYRCPRPVVERAVRLVEHNQERFAKEVRAGPKADGRLVLAPDAADDHVRIARVIGSWPRDGGTGAILARTNRELLPAIAVALELGLPFRAPGLPLILESPLIDALLADVRGDGEPGWPLIVRLGALRARVARDGSGDGGTPEPGDDAGERDELAAGGAPERRDAPAPDLPDPDALSFTPEEVASALVAWAAPYPDLEAFAEAVGLRRARLATLRRDDAPLTFATAHSTKGLEFDHVAVVGLDAGRFPSARSLADAPDPERALEEERRLAYVAWTRARRSLTLVYDPGAPSRFLFEAFSPDELGVDHRLHADAAS